MFSDTEYSFTLRENSSNVIFRATAGLCPVSIYPRIARIVVLISAHVKNSSVSGYGYVNSCGVQINGHIDTEVCL